jgi:murein DD-endopeptidase MepM/ murein hydrolase activator NlpD
MHRYPHPPFKIGGGHLSGGYTPSHRAKDITHRNDALDTVYAIESGTVSDIQSGQQHGDDNPNMVIIRDSHGFLTVYGHVDPSVFAGQSANQGDEIGTVDLSGRTDGIHVHLVRLKAGEGTVDDVLDRQNKAENFQINLGAW